MTTIASDGVVLCTDDAVNDGDQHWSVPKAEKVGGAWYATSGSASDGEKFMTWIRRGRRGARPKLENSFGALALTKEGLVLYDCDLVPMKLPNPHAIGTGGKCARIAMLCGKTPAEAVELACLVDNDSRTPVHTYTLEEEKA